MKTISVTNQKGGVGKTALACHLAFHLRDEGHRVLFVDLDDQANASFTLGDSASGVVASQLFESAAVSLPEQDGITLVGADPKLANLGDPDMRVIERFTKQMQDFGALDRYDYAVVDCNPSKGLRMIAALLAAEYTVAPIELESYSIQGITQLLAMVYGLKKEHNPRLTFLGMVPSRFNANSPAQKEHLQQILASYSHLMLRACIGNRSAVAEALGTKKPVWEVKKTAARLAAKEMRQAVTLITAKMETPE